MSEIAVLRSVGGLIFDATFEEAHESELFVTDNPVESGVLVSDHAYMGPLKLNITAGVTDTPLSVQPNDQFASNVSRARRAFELLSALQKAAEPFDVQTGLTLYKNMLCTSIRAVQNKDSANTFEFIAELREVIIVTTQVVSYPPRKAGKTKRQASKARDKGEVNSDATTGTKKQSLAKKLFGMIGTRP